MNIKEIITRARDANPELAGLSDKDADALLRTVFRQLRSDLEGAAHESALNVAVLGRFKVKLAEVKGDGGATKSVRRIAFTPQAAAAKK